MSDQQGATVLHGRISACLGINSTVLHRCQGWRIRWCFTWKSARGGQNATKNATNLYNRLIFYQLRKRPHVTNMQLSATKMLITAGIWAISPLVGQQCAESRRGSCQAAYHNSWQGSLRGLWQVLCLVAEVIDPSLGSKFEKKRRLCQCHYQQWIETQPHSICVEFC